MNQQKSITASDNSATTVVLILCTVPSKAVATKIATKLVESRLAACVNIVPGLTSIYKWEKKIEHGEELLLLIKSTMNRFGQIADQIRTLHPYELPEILAIPNLGGAVEYLNWVRSETNDLTLNSSNN